MAKILGGDILRRRCSAVVTFKVTTFWGGDIWGGDIWNLLGPPSKCRHSDSNVAKCRHFWKIVETLPPPAPQNVKCLATFVLNDPQDTLKMVATFDDISKILVGWKRACKPSVCRRLFQWPARRSSSIFASSTSAYAIIELLEPVHKWEFSTFRSIITRLCKKLIFDYFFANYIYSDFKLFEAFVR